MGQTTYALLNEYIPEIKFSGRLNTTDQVSEGETVEFNAGASKFVSDADYNKILHGFYKESGSRCPWLGEAAPQPECCSVCAQKAPARPGLPWSCPPA